MFGGISKKIVDRLLDKGAIHQDDYEIYLFGMEQLLTTILDVLSAIVIGILFGRVLQTIIFVISFMVIRSYAGGYHAATPLRCYVLTILTVILALSAMKYMEWHIFYLLGILMVSSVVILILAPVDTENKRIDDVEFIHYRRKTVIVWGIETFIALLFALFQFKIGVESIVFTELTLSISLICENV